MRDFIFIRYQAQDFNGQLLAEISAIKTPRPAFAPIFSNQFGLNQQHWLSKVPIKVNKNVRYIFNFSLFFFLKRNKFVCNF